MKLGLKVKATGKKTDNTCCCNWQWQFKKMGKSSIEFTVLNDNEWHTLLVYMSQVTITH
jgi:hypothetical protein